MKSLHLFVAVALSMPAFAGEVGPPQPLGPCSAKQCSSSRVAGFEAAVLDLQRKHPRNAGVTQLAAELRGRAAPAQNTAIRGHFGFEPNMDIEDVEAAIVRRTVTGQDDPLTPVEVGVLADLWVGAKE